VDWYIWRLLTSPKLHGVTWADLNSTMSHDDLVAANELLDALEFADAMSRKGA
jgi:hypothetical protein